MFSLLCKELAVERPGNGCTCRGRFHFGGHSELALGQSEHVDGQNGCEKRHHRQTDSNRDKHATKVGDTPCKHVNFRCNPGKTGQQLQKCNPSRVERFRTRPVYNMPSP